MHYCNLSLWQCLRSLPSFLPSLNSYYLGVYDVTGTVLF